MLVGAPPKMSWELLVDSPSVRKENMILWIQLNCFAVVLDSHIKVFLSKGFVSESAARIDRAR